METDKTTLSNLIKKQVEQLNRLLEKAKENNLVVEITSNEYAMVAQKDRYVVCVYEKVMY